MDGFRSATICAWVGRGGGSLTQSRLLAARRSSASAFFVSQCVLQCSYMCTLLSSRQGALGAVCYAAPCRPRLDLRIAAAGLRFGPIPPSRLLRLPVHASIIRHLLSFHWDIICLFSARRSSASLHARYQNLLYANGQSREDTERAVKSCLKCMQDKLNF